MKNSSFFNDNSDNVSRSIYSHLTRFRTTFYRQSHRTSASAGSSLQLSSRQLWRRVFVVFITVWLLFGNLVGAAANSYATTNAEFYAATHPPTKPLLPATFSLSGLKAQYQVGDPGLPSDQQLKPYLQIFNTGSTSVNLSDVTVRYWYTLDSSSSTAQTYSCDYALVACANVCRHRLYKCDCQLWQRLPDSDRSRQLWWKWV